MIRKAIGIKYEMESETAPKITAKGSGSIADKIIRIAEEYKIPIHKDPDLIEVLAGVELNREIPQKAYQVIAEILAFVYSMNNKLKETRGEL